MIGDTRQQPTAHAAENGSEPASGFRWQWADELEAPDEPDWIWRGYVAPGMITLIAGKPKSGKSTLVCAMAEAHVAGTGSFLDRSLRSGPVVYVSEEGAGTLKPKLSGRVRVLTRDAAWPRPGWHELIAEAIAEARRIGAHVLIVDSLSFWSAASLGEGQRNDDVVMQRIFAAFGEATRDGLAVVLVHHQRKGGGESGDAVLGSTAIFGAVDMLVEVERLDGDSAPTQRQLVATGRWETPVLIVDYNPRERSWRVVGEVEDRGSASALGTRERILTALPGEPPGASEDELAERLNLDKRKVSGPLRKLLTQGAVSRDGKGVAFNPFRYWRNTAPNTAPSEGSVGVECLPLPVGGADSTNNSAPTLPWGRVESAVDCSNRDGHIEHHKEHPSGGRVICTLCHPPAKATA